MASPKVVAGALSENKEGKDKELQLKFEVLPRLEIHVLLETTPLPRAFISFDQFHDFFLHAKTVSFSAASLSHLEHVFDDHLVEVLYDRLERNAITIRAVLADPNSELFHRLRPQPQPARASSLADTFELLNGLRQEKPEAVSVRLVDLPLYHAIYALTGPDFDVVVVADHFLNRSSIACDLRIISKDSPHFRLFNEELEQLLSASARIPNPVVLTRPPPLPPHFSLYFNDETADILRHLSQVPDQSPLSAAERLMGER